jgi:hypothetical protein
VPLEFTLWSGGGGGGCTKMQKVDEASAGWDASFCWCGSSRSAEQIVDSLVSGQWFSGLAYLFYFRLRVPETFYLPRHSSSLRAIPLPSSSTDNRPFHSGSSPRKVHSDPVCAQGNGPTSSDTRCQAGFQAIEKLAQQPVRPRVVNRIPARSRAKG